MKNVKDVFRSIFEKLKKISLSYYNDYSVSEY